MINCNDHTNENNTKHSPNWPYILDHPYRILIIGGSGPGKKNALLNLIKTNQKLREYISMQKILMKQNINF